MTFHRVSDSKMSSLLIRDGMLSFAFAGLDDGVPPWPRLELWRVPPDTDHPVVERVEFSTRPDWARVDVGVIIDAAFEVDDDYTCWWAGLVDPTEGFVWAFRQADVLTSHRFAHRAMTAAHPLWQADRPHRQMAVSTFTSANDPIAEEISRWK